MNEQQLDRLVRSGEVVSYKKNNMIYVPGEPSEYFYFVLAGSVKLGVSIDEERTIIKEIIYDNDVFGENLFVANQLRKEFAKCFADAEVIRIKASVMREVIMENIDCAEFMTKIIIERLSHLQKRMQSFTYKSAKERIIDFIKSTAQKRGLRIGINECLINHGMTHKEIAFLTDTSRQTVARILGDLKKNNVIHFGSRKPGKILIRDRDWALAM